MTQVLFRLLVPLAVLVALLFTLAVGPRLVRMRSFTALLSNAGGDGQPADPAQACYPFRWQGAQREKLHALLERTTTPPTGSDALALAQYAEYAMLNRTEAIIDEGMRRDPGNALYHYLRADQLLERAIDGKPPKFDKKTGVVHYSYRVLDRPRLDRAMHELALGQALPYHSRRLTLVQARLAAMPPQHRWDDRLAHITVMAGVLFPEFGRIRNIAWVNGFYLSLLLKEGRRAEAEPFLHTGERLALQISQDDLPTLIGQLVALAVSDICEKHAGSVCRSYGLTREAAEIVRRNETLTAGLRQFHAEAKVNEHRAQDALVRDAAGVLTSALLPIMGKQTWVTRETLRPSRLVEYILAEEILLSLLPLALLMLMLLAGLKILRWRIAARGTPPEALGTEITLSARGWWQALGYGFALPLALYLLYSAIPALSGREHGIKMSIWHFGIGAGLFILWVLLAPALIASAEIWRRNLAAGVIPATQPKITLALRALAGVLGYLWVAAAWMPLLLVPGALIASLILAQTTLPTDPVVWVLMPIWGALVLGVVLLPTVWERKRAAQAVHFIAVSRTVARVYAVLILLLCALYPATVALERHYLAQDTLMSVELGKHPSFTMLESRLVQQLQQSVLDGQAKLDKQ